MNRNGVTVALIASAFVGVVGGGYYAYEDKLDRADAVLQSVQAQRAAEVADRNARIAAVEADLAEATAPRFFAKAKASRNAEFDAAIQVGLRYWEGRDGQTPATTIVLDKSNPCGEGAVGCAWTIVKAGKATCHIWMHPELQGNRWALTAVATHEVGHCMGYGHDETDIVMHP
jgi:hypothetical protein